MPRINARQAMTLGLALIVLFSAVNIAGSAFDEKPFVVCYYDFPSIGSNVGIVQINDCDNNVPLPKPNAPTWCTSWMPWCLEWGKLVSGPHPYNGGY
jgi:hypothetical protein